ncbi:MAG: FAD-dependent thymidylate synthase [Candidatus Methylomirabilales bacterium]
MKQVEPQVFLLARPAINEEGLAAYLRAVGASGWDTDAPSAGEKLIEVAGRSCYRSFEPGLNPNVTKVREGSKAYLENILSVRHGSVIEHANWTFAFFNVSRVFTHELVRHRVGTAMSQESLRFVRLTEIGMWLPPEIRENPEALAVFEEAVVKSEEAQQRLADVLAIEGRPFHEKKVLTSAMRRVAPDGVATTIIWTANARTLRWVIEARTEPGAEVEIRVVFGRVAEIMKKDATHLFADFTPIPLPDGTSQWKPRHSKV